MKRKIIILSFLLIIFLVYCTTTDDIITIGSIQQLTGLMGKYGKTTMAAVTAQMELINEDRINKGLPEIRVIFEDDQLQPSVGVAAIRKLIDIDGAIAVLGAHGSSVTQAMAPIAESNQVILMSGASGSPAISDAGDYIFRTCPSDFLEGSMMAQYYNENHPGKSLGIIYINNDYGLGLKNVFNEKTDPKPAKVVELPYTQGAVDFRSHLTRIKQENIEVVYIVGYEEMITIYKQATELALKCIWLGNNQLNDQSLIDRMGTTADGTVFPGHKFELEEIKSRNSRFYQRYLELSEGEELDVFAAYGVEALQIINYVMLEGASTGVEIKEALYNISQFEGLNGTFHFDEHGDAIRILALYIIQNGQIVKYQ
ncbi:ABC transporter substrate-binding protein [candidate division KSB1 bacterium]